MLQARVLASTCVACLGIAYGSAFAQSFPAFGNIEARLGAVHPLKSKPGFSQALESDLGYLGSPAVRSVVGLSHYTADIDRRTSAGPVPGSIAAWGAHAGIRLDPWGGRLIAPYLVTVLSGQSVQADVADPAVQELVDGFDVGAGFGGGVAVALNSARTIAAIGDVRRTFVSDAGHWTYELGVRYMPHGPEAYTAELSSGVVPSAQWARDEETRRLQRENLALRQRQEEEAARLRAAAAVPVPAAVSPPASEAERLRLERERLEAERLRFEQDRLEAERRRGEESRLAAERARGDAQANVLRAQADSLEAARQRESAARTAAERTARIATVRADSIAALAQRQALEEANLYEAFQDLYRGGPNDATVHDTERGLVIVLGQGQFASGRAPLLPAGRTACERIAAVLKRVPEHRLLVVGHSDAVGSATNNQRLSEQRAQAVAAALVAAGIDPGRIESAGYGASQPVAENTTAAGRERNRRVEIVVLGLRRQNVAGQ